MTPENDPLAGFRTEEHVEGTTFVFRENHSFWRRSTRWGLVGLIGATLALAVLVVVLSAGLGSRSAGLMDGEVWFLVALGAVVVGGPLLVTLAGVGLGLLAMADAGQTWVRLTVGHRGITIERRSEGEEVHFAPSGDLRVELDAETRFPTLRITDGRERIEIPVLARRPAVEALAAAIEARCVVGGNRAAVPEGLRALQAQ